MRLATILCAGLAGRLVSAANSVGQLGDPKLDRNHPTGDNTRYYYAGTDAASSQKTNALGDDQVLFYDYLPHRGSAIKATVLYLHGGGYNVGYANNGGTYNEGDLWRDMGFDLVICEYRRGWNGDGSGGVAGINTGDGLRFMTAVEYAKADVLDCWDHFHTQVRASVGAHPHYLVAGTSAGGSLASRVTLTNAALNRNVVGAVVGFGTHDAAEPVVNFNIPTCIQGGLFDDIQPPYENKIFYDTTGELPLSKGLFDLRNEIVNGGGKALMFMGGQSGHGFGVYQDDNELPTHYGTCKQFFKDVYKGVATTNTIEYKFKRSDPVNYPGQSYPSGATDTIVTTSDVPPMFRYDPYQTDFQNGDTLAQVCAKYSLPFC